jgi:lipoyl(octanoyl) transferase
LPDNQNILTNLSHSIRVIDLGLSDYDYTWKYQTELHEKLIFIKRNQPENFPGHSLVFCEHPHVFTLGKSGDESNLLQAEHEMDAIQAKFYRINRGGDITYHGPGQLVAYPILDLDYLFTDVHKFVRLLEQTVMDVLSEFGVKSCRIEGLTGVWIVEPDKKPRKICAIGVHLSRWVSLHGLAFNINTDLNYFNYIIPCGIDPQQKEVTSLSRELGRIVPLEEVKVIFIHYFVKHFNLNIIS